MPFVLVHLAVFGALWSGVTFEAVVACLVLYAVRMFAVTAGYHRYFAHRSFKTSRTMQLVLAFLAETSAQKGVLWWASHHRAHHEFADTDGDPHSPLRRGFWYAHLGWIFDNSDETEHDRIRDLLRYPELRWLDRHHLLPPAILALGMLLLFGWPGLFIGFALSTVLVWHATFAINSLAHLIGRRRFPTRDGSRNSMALALLTFGEGWHNNHHYFRGSTRQGFRWWEVDLTYYLLKLGSLLGVFWELRAPPAEVGGGGAKPAVRVARGT